MAAIKKDFVGNDFFDLTRDDPNWTNNLGMFHGREGNLHYVIMDASFYKLEIFERPSNLRFTKSALDAQSQSVQDSSGLIRLTANGQFFGPDESTQPFRALREYSYCHDDPCVTHWQGEIVDDHIQKVGTPPSYPKMRYFGQFDGRTQRAFEVGLGDPSEVDLGNSVFNGEDPRLRNALGRLAPLITNGVKATKVNIPKSWDLPASTGKMVYGIHRGSNTVFVLAEEDDNGIIAIPDLIDLLENMGVSDAVLADSGSSSTLIVDQLVVVAPKGIFDRKDKSIPVGPMFRLQTPTVQGDLAINQAATTIVDVNIDNMDTLPGFEATLSLADNGVALIISSMGSVNLPGSGLTVDTFDFLNVQGSLTKVLMSDSGNIIQDSNFSNFSGSITASLRLEVSSPSDNGSLVGTMTITVPAESEHLNPGNLVLDCNLDLTG